MELGDRVQYHGFALAVTRVYDSPDYVDVGTFERIPICQLVPLVPELGPVGGPSEWDRVVAASSSGSAPAPVALPV